MKPILNLTNITDEDWNHNKILFDFISSVHWAVKIHYLNIQLFGLKSSASVYSAFGTETKVVVVHLWDLKSQGDVA